MTKTILQIEGMSCGHCLNAVNKALAAVPSLAIESVQIGRAEVTHDPAVASVPMIVAAVEAAGFHATAA